MGAVLSYSGLILRCKRVARPSIYGIRISAHPPNPYYLFFSFV